MQALIKHITVLLGVITLIGCTTPKQNNNPPPVEEPKVIVDTVYVYITDTIYNTIVKEKLTDEALAAMYQVERVKRYIEITEAKPTNKTFFYGWIKRVFDE